MRRVGGGERWERRQRREERLSVVLRAANQNFYACRWQAYLCFVAAVEKTEPFSNGDKFFRAPQQDRWAPVMFRLYSGVGGRPMAAPT